MNSPTPQPRLLVVDDQVSMTRWLCSDLQGRGFTTEASNSPEEIVDQLPQLNFDLVLTDVRMPRISGLELCREITARRPDIPVIVMTAFGDMEAAIEAMRAGAYDFITKPLEVDLLEIALQRAVDHRRLQMQLEKLEKQMQESSRAGVLVGESPIMLDLIGQIERAGPSGAAILITGESGTGKELVARALHDSSARKAKPFIAVNCAALPEALIESELFGHAKGAFTDARDARKGLFAQADGGTLFLDEIGDLPLNLQAKLLRVLEQQTIRPIGSDQEQAIDVRVLSATHQDLEAKVEREEFRQDLYYRLNVIEIEVPPLRARGNDVLLLAHTFLQQFAEKSGKAVVGIAEPAATKLLDYDWPGNVRELRNVLERAVAMTQYDRVIVDDLPARVQQFTRNEFVFGSEDPSNLVSLAELEQRYIVHVLQMVGNNRTRAARLLGLDRKTLYRKLKAQESETDE
ncbi:MAG: sigma-54 dependent transcriptional regulator [Planctomycetota bacterium]|jgi:two-component system response regulator HydG|nr:sigma-54 dependent transcriptional regulator [Planctomycetota bacterium]MEC7446956.1 sigma-54 dependent transcriptional regulator [Planctomycetota bacterium]MEC7597991.1 sigma-54 dependent transcriptional regulator [Planctomycetota bacterium]MEC7718103.1 sigma-54 dependent transcriptional regulator [Planctomycetota bacterium]MEE3077203.1 sigma-54 dependent transcriptional regulator [Planctomycetota bacterium]